jgi:hypothetical protein
MVNVGVDLHKTQFTVCVRDGSGKGDRFEQYPTTKEGYKRFLREMAVLREAGEVVRVGVESTETRGFSRDRWRGWGSG